MNRLALLAQLIHQRNAAEIEITRIINRPAAIGHLGEYIASKIFGIDLVVSASHKAIDGYFAGGALAGRSVNIKWYAKHDGLLDITPEALPDYYLVLSGPKAVALSSRGEVRPWLISQVYCIEARPLLNELAASGVKVGVATSVRKSLWTTAEVYPSANNSKLVLSGEQRELLGLFG